MDGGRDAEAGSIDDAAADAEEPFYSIEACEGARSQASATDGFPPCDDVCAQAHCLPTELAEGVPELAACADDGTGQAGRCVPDPIAVLSRDEGVPFQFSECTFFVNGTRGACLPLCYLGSDGIAFLRRDVCGADELCVPCLDDQGRPNGLCDLCDVELDAGVDGGGDAGMDGGVQDAGEDGGRDDAGGDADT